MKILVTGSNGFVGKYLVELLKQNNRDKVFGLDRDNADITNFNSVKKYIKKIQPDQVYHLAGFASGAGKDKDLIFKVNINGTENILRALIETKQHPRGVVKPVRVLLASTAYVYGNTDTCTDENSKTNAISFYDQSKLKMEEWALRQCSGRARTIDIVITRATNHTGPGQKPGFVVPDFCQAIANSKSGQTIAVGNLEAKRDLFDVRDCVRAYKIVMEKGKSGEIYNIGTGKTVSIKEILEKLIKISGKNIKYKIDPTRMRASDIANNCVNASKIMQLGWRPEIELNKTLEETYKYYINNT